MAKESCPWCHRSKPDASLRKLEELGLATMVDAFCWYGIRRGATCTDREGTVRAEAYGGLRVVGYVEGQNFRLSVANRDGQAVLIGSVEVDEDREIVRAIGDVCRAMEIAILARKYRERRANVKDEELVILKADGPPEDLDP